MATPPSIMETLASYGSYILAGFAIYYLFRAITFGGAEKAKSVGGGLKSLAKKAKKIPRKTNRVLRREYHIAKNLKKHLERFKIAMGIGGSGSLSKQSEEYKNLREELDNAVNMYNVLGDLVKKSEDITNKTSKKDIKKDLKLYDGEIRLRLAKSGTKSIISFVNGAVHHKKAGNTAQMNADLNKAVDLTKELIDYILDIQATENKIRKLT